MYVCMSYIIYNIFYLLNTCTVPGYQIRIYIFFFFISKYIYIFCCQTLAKYEKKTPSMFNVLRATNGKPLKSNNVMYSYVYTYICVFMVGILTQILNMFFASFEGPFIRIQFILHSCFHSFLLVKLL